MIFYHQDIENPHMLVERLKPIKVFLQQEENKGYSSDIMMKYRWMKNYYNRALDKVRKNETLDMDACQLV